LYRLAVETRELPAKAAPADLILVAAAATQGPARKAANNAAAAERSPQQRAASSERRRRRRRMRVVGRNPRLADPALGRRGATLAPFCRFDASSFEISGRGSLFLVRTRRDRSRFRGQLRAVDVMIGCERCRNGQGRRRPQRRRPPYRGLRIKTNPAIAARARDR
jgi:hypothetical protein